MTLILQIYEQYCRIVVEVDNDTMDRDNSKTMIHHSVQLQPHNTLNICAISSFFAEIDSVQTLQKILTNSDLSALNKLVLGSGSNVLFVHNYDGLILKNKIKGISILNETDAEITLTVGGGENWHDFVLYCVDHNYGGIENLSYIPGTVGAAPVQNIGAYGTELISVFESLKAVNLEDGTIHKFTKDDCHFGYRDSIFKHPPFNKFFIAEVTFKLNKQPTPNISYKGINEKLKLMGIDHPTIKDVSQAIIAIRQDKLPDPKILPNAGSFFKNPIISSQAFSKLQQQFANIPHYPQPNDTIKLPAAWLIEQCGLKGFRENGVGVSPNHALVLVNYNSQEGQSIVSLSQHIIDAVATKFNITLLPEVNFIKTINQPLK